MNDVKKEMYDKYKIIRKNVKENGIKSLSDEDRKFFRNFHKMILK
jgi:hypothetical protein